MAGTEFGIGTCWFGESQVDLAKAKQGMGGIYLIRWN